MKFSLLLLFYLLIGFLPLNSQENANDFVFSSIRDEIGFLNDTARGMDKSNPAKQLELALEAYELSLRESYYEGQAIALGTIGQAYFNLQIFDRSLNSYIKGIELSRNINLHSEHWYSSYSLGELFSYLKDYDNANNYFSAAEDLLSDDKDKRFIKIYRGKAVILKNQQNYEEAISIINKALKITDSESDSESIYDLSILLGDIHYLAGNIKSAVLIYESLINDVTLYGQYQERNSIIFSSLGKCYSLLKDYNLALVYGQKGLLLSARINSKAGRLFAYESLSFIYENMSNYKDAFLNFKLYYDQKIIYDELKNESDISKIKAYYGSFEKEIEIDKQQNEIALQDRLIIAGAFLLFFAVLLITILYILYKKHSKMADKLKKDLNKEIIFSRTDPVTGLPNRKSIEEKLSLEIKKWNEELVDFSMIMFQRKA